MQQKKKRFACAFLVSTDPHFFVIVGYEEEEKCEKKKNKNG
jgi:hypothetical protein